MKEDFLHKIWHYRLFECSKVHTECGQSLDILAFGTENLDAGPDLFNAKIRLGNTVWAGNIEIHVKASDWFKHKHQYDPAYQNIILHVVYENDVVVHNNLGVVIPAFSLKKYIHQGAVRKISYLRQSTDWVPCTKLLKQTSKLWWIAWKDRLLVEKLERACLELSRQLVLLQSDWEALLYQQLGRYMGVPVNAAAFQLATRHLPFKIVQKHCHKLNDLEALFLGIGGFLNKSIEDEYVQQLKKEFDYLKAKYELQVLKKEQWKFSKMRPAAFPTVRLALFARLQYERPQLMQAILETQDLDSLQKLFKVQASTYWDTHYVLGKTSKSIVKKLGTKSIYTLIINAVVPFLFWYGKQMGRTDLKERAIGFLEQLPKEKNQIIEQWEAIEVESDNAFDSQALIYLKKSYCNSYSCLDCHIGKRLIREN